MTRMLSRLLFQALPTLLLVSMIVYLLAVSLPGDPTRAILGEDATVEQREALRDELGLNRPVWVQYADWMEKLATGDLGTALRTGEPIREMLALRLPVTLELTILSILMATIIGVAAGTLAAVWRGTVIDIGLSATAVVSFAVPYFWGGILLIMLFAVNLKWLPPSGYVPFLSDPAENLRAMVLPAITVGTHLAALIMRQTRSAMIQVLSEDYIRTARAKGNRRFRVVVHHGLRNCLIPVTTVIGLQTGTLIGGTVVVETIFSLPGLGSMIVNGIFWRDFPVVQGGVIVVVILVVLINLTTDLVYSALDPRVRA